MSKPKYVYYLWYLKITHTRLRLRAIVITSMWPKMSKSHKQIPRYLTISFCKVIFRLTIHCIHSYGQHRCCCRWRCHLTTPTKPSPCNAATWQVTTWLHEIDKIIWTQTTTTPKIFSKEMRAHTSDCMQKFWQWCFFLPQTKEAMDHGEIFVFLFRSQIWHVIWKVHKTFQSSELPIDKNKTRNIIVSRKFEI